MKIFTLLTLILVFVSFNTFAAPIVLSVGPATDTDCDYNSIFDAVNSANVNMDIRVSNELITTTGVTISDNKVTLLSGGYFNCVDAENGTIDINTPYSDISNLNNGPALSVTFTKMHSTIDVSGFKIYDSQGGVQVFSGFFNTRLNMDGVDIYDNTFYGLKTSGTGVSIYYDHGRIENNTEADKGGGVECYDGSIHFGEDVKIKNNSAILGGGIYASKCSIEITAGDTNTLATMEYGVVNNEARDAGAGVYLKESSLYGGNTPNHPISISGNTITSDVVDGRGAGVYMLSGSSVNIYNARIDGNKATVAGAALASFHDDFTLSEPDFQLSRSNRACTYSEICVSLSENSVSNEGSYGALIFQVGKFGTGLNYINDAIIQQNIAPNSNSIFKVKSKLELTLSNNLIINNTSQNHLFDMEDESSISVRFSTLADNTVQNYFNLQFNNAIPQNLKVYASIIKNGQSTIATFEDDFFGHDASVECSLVEVNDEQGIVQNQSIISLPRFIGNGNYKLLPDSLAIDSNCAEVITVLDPSSDDIRGLRRPESGMGMIDLGAYEMNNDVIFSHGFE